MRAYDRDWIYGFGSLGLNSVAWTMFCSNPTAPEHSQPRLNFARMFYLELRGQSAPPTLFLEHCADEVQQSHVQPSVHSQHSGGRDVKDMQDGKRDLERHLLPQHPAYMARLCKDGTFSFAAGSSFEESLRSALRPLLLECLSVPSLNLNIVKTGC